MIILPSMGRPENLRRFVQAYRMTCGTLPIHVILDAADAHNYNEVQIPYNWKKVSVPAGSRLGDIFNMIFEKYPNEAYYGMVADDIIPQTLIWDVILRDACLPDKIAWGNDEIQKNNLPVHPFIGGDLVRKLGWWAAPGLKHWFVDNVWKALADHLKCGVYLPQLKMPHHHFINGKAPHDKTYANQPSHEQDHLACMEFMKKDFVAAIERAKA